MAAEPEPILDFWLEAGPKRWFAKSAAFDQEIARRFTAIHHAAARGELGGWSGFAGGALALTLLFDQIPRHIFRGSPHAFATDPLARAVARGALEAGHDLAVDPRLRSFFYMPFMHAEDLADQNVGLDLFERLEREGGQSARWAHDHRDIIARFGHFPHRNARLGRQTTADEQAFLDGGGFAG
jgi:uncharacterized protein (DUF924 family)